MKSEQIILDAAKAQQHPQDPWNSMGGRQGELRQSTCDVNLDV